MDLAGSNTGSTISLTANGAISDASAASPIISGTSLQLVASFGSGPGDAIETQVTSLAASNTTSGNIEINETDALDVTKVDQAATIGTVTVVAGGTITVVAGQSGVSAVDGQVQLMTTGAGRGHRRP